MTGLPVDIDGVRDAVLRVLDEPPGTLDYDEDLLSRGLDSIQVIRLASSWRRAGVDITFAELIEHRTLRRWWTLLNAKCSDGIPGGTGAPAAPAADWTDQPFPLTTMQQAYWVGRGVEQVLGGVGAQFYCEFNGSGVDPRRLDEALGVLVDRHAMLRASFSQDGRQKILAAGSWAGLTLIDLRESTGQRAAERLAELRRELSHRSMAADRGQVFDAVLTLLPERATRLHFAIDMLVCDAQSFRIVLADLARIYAGDGADLASISFQFPDYLNARASRGLKERERDRKWWLERIDELPAGPQLPLAVDATELQERRNIRLSHVLSAPDWATLSGYARQESVLLSMVLITAFAEVLGAWSENKRFLLNLPFYDRDELHPDVQSLVGDFTNLVLLTVDVSDNIPFADRVRAVQKEFHADLAHTAFNGVDVGRELSRRRPGEQSPAPVVFTTAINLGELFSQEFRDSFGTPGWTMSTTPQVWLDCQVTERGGGLFVNWDVVEGLFPASVVEGMFEGFVGLLHGLVHGSFGVVGDLVPLDVSAQRAAVNGSVGAVPSGGLHDGFFRWADRDAARVALLGDFGSVSFGELAQRALRLAGGLVRRGVLGGDAVGVSLARGPDQIVAVLGVLAAGGVYVPVGVTHPVARRDRIMRSACARVMVLDSGSEVEDSMGVGIGVLESGAGLAAPVEVSGNDLAYVIYTSGSTGEPKGVEVSHRAALNTVIDVRERFGVDGSDRVLALSALDFDLSVFDLFGLLGVGGSVVLIADHEVREAVRWVELVAAFGVSVWNSVPALVEMALVAGAGRSGWAESLRVCLASGDWVAPDLGVRLGVQAPGCGLVALGGATEAGIWSNAFEVARDEALVGWRSVPYGAPLRNQRFRVVDERGRDCPDWVVGELWIGGVGVAQGYRGDPVRTAAQFLTDVDGVRWYRTGDLGRYRPGAVLEFLGRRDLQVKIGGYRIELGEIEAALTAHHAVDQAVAVVINTGTGRRLAAAITTTRPADLAVLTAVRAAAAEHLPGYMVPDVISALDVFPLSANAKIDRRALADILTRGATSENTSNPATPDSTADQLPRLGTETTLADIWADLLTHAPIYRHHNFFTLGGDSLLATQMLARLRTAGYADVRNRTLLNNPTLAGFAAALPNPDVVVQSPTVLRSDPDGRFDSFPTTDVQRAYWMGRTSGFTLGGVGSHWYWELDGIDVDIARLERAWNAVIARHDMLRAVFDDDGNQQVRAEVPYVRIPVRETTDENDADSALAQLRAELSHRIADPSAWPLTVISAVRIGAQVRLAFSFDYMVLDALSIIIVFRELAARYGDPGVDLAPLDVTFRDYVLGDTVPAAERIAAEDYWRGRAALLPAAPQLPLALDPASIAAPRFVRYEAVIERNQWATIVQRAQADQLTPAAVLATAFAEVLGYWSESDALTINMTLFDRREVHPQINQVIGDFTSLLLAAYEPVAGQTFLQACWRFQERIWTDLEHRSVSALWVLRERARQSGATGVNMPVVFTSALGLPADVVDLDLPFGRPGWGVSQTPQVWLDCQVTERGGGLFVNWDVVEGLFPPGVVEGMFEAFAGLLRELEGGIWGAVGVGWRGANGPAGVAPGASRARFIRSATNDDPTDGHTRQLPLPGTETTLAHIWADLLTHTPVYRHQNFFTLGGDSLLATQLVEAIRRQFVVPMTLRQILTVPTISALAAAIDSISPDIDAESFDEGVI